MTTLDSSQWMYSSGTTGFYPHTIGQSLRFEDGDSAYLTRTPSGAGNRKTFTLSFWHKKCSSAGFVFAARNNSAGSFFAIKTSADTLEINDSQSSDALQLITTQVFRDVSAWYNIVVAIDTTQSTSSNRAKLYVNGEQVTSFSTSSYPNQSADMMVNSTIGHYLGCSVNASGNPALFIDAYLAEVNFIDGTALNADSFGETKAGIWIPKDTSGLTFGTNGFRLKFQDSSALGDDTSGNGNDFSSSGLAATDVVLDSPTNNFATMNPLNGDGGTTWKEGNLELSTANKGNNANTFLMESGKWYWEAIGTGYVGGVCAFDRGTYNNTISISGSDSIGYYTNGYVYWGTGNNSTPATYNSTDIIGVAVNMDDGEISFYKNNSLQVTLAFSSTISRLATEGCYAAYNNGSTSTTKQFNVNFGQDSSFAGNKTAQGNADGNGIGDFYYSPPSGFLALCTANLPNPAIDPAEDEEPADHFNTVLYSGDGSSSQSITGVGFEPAWTWIKSRGNAYAWHALIDSVRGVTKFLYSNVYNTEATSSAPFKSFNIDGFSVGSDTSTARTNVSGETYVAWNWLASTSVSGSTSGAGTSKSYSGKSNTTSGFSIIAYAGNGTSGHDVPHHLGVKPEMIITKSRNYSYDWMVYHKDIPTTYSHPPYIEWNETAAAVTSSQMFEEPTSSYMGLYSNGAINRNGGNHISYCFASKDGYSRVGSYTGNGSTDGTFVYTGFRPAWLMIKRTNSTADWIVFDSKRDIDNEITQFLYPNASYAEATGSGVLDFLSNGFKLRGSTANRNASGSHYIFLCFAEQPFKYSNAR